MTGNLSIVDNVSTAGNDATAISCCHVTFEAILVSKRGRWHVQVKFASGGDVEVGRENGRVKLDLKNVEKWAFHNNTSLGDHYLLVFNMSW